MGRSPSAAAIVRLGWAGVNGRLENVGNSPLDPIDKPDAMRQYGGMKRKCLYCGAKFYPIVPQQRYCSPSHRQMGYERRKKGLPERRPRARTVKGGQR